MPKLSLKSKKPAKKKLTIKQKKFTAEVIKTGNATQAAIKAGYSKKTASEMGYENLNKPQIKAEIQSAAAKLGIDAEYVLKNFKDIADFNKEKIVVARVKKDVDGEFQEIVNEEMRDAAAAIKSTEMLGKHLSLFTEKLELTGKDGKDLILPSAERLSIAAKKIALLLSQANSK